MRCARSLEGVSYDDLTRNAIDSHLAFLREHPDIIGRIRKRVGFFRKLAEEILGMLCEYAGICEKYKQALGDRKDEDAVELTEEVCNNPGARVFQGCYVRNVRISDHPKNKLACFFDKSKEAQKPRKSVPALPNVDAVGVGIPRMGGIGGVEWH